MRDYRALPFVILATFALVACTDGAGPRGAGKVSLALLTVQPSTSPSTVAAAGLSASLQAGGPETFTDASNNTVAVSSVELVLRKVELKPVERAACDESSQATVATAASDGHDGNDEHEMNDADEDCDELEAGPILVDLPLGGVERMFEATVPAGTFDELRFQIHKPSTDGDAADQAFLAANPDFAGISVRVKGTFNGADFTYTSDLNVEQELRFDPPVTVTAGTRAWCEATSCGRSRASRTTTRTAVMTTMRPPSPEPELRGGDQRRHVVAGVLQRGPTPLLPVYHRQHPQHSAAGGFDRTDRVERRPTGGDHVLHDYRRGPGSETPLDPLPGAVGLGLLAHGEGVDRAAAPWPPTGAGDRERYGVRAQREPAHHIGPPPESRQALQREGPDDRQPFRRHGGAACVDVEARATSGRQHEVAPRDRALAQELAQSLLEVRCRAHESCE